MDRTELIESLADNLTRLDVLRSRFDTGTAERLRLDGLRDLLDAQLRHLIRNAFKDNTAAYKEATEVVTAAIKEIKKTIDDLKKIADTFNNVVALVKAVDGLIEVVAPLL